jgi:hypothetical protein
MSTKEVVFKKDIRIGIFEKELGLEPGSIRNPDGTAARRDKKIVTLKKEYAEARKKFRK